MDYLTEIAPLLFPNGARGGLMAVLAGYFDDSGTHDASQVVVVAGAVASVQQWQRFSKQWEMAVRPWRLSKGYFHMTDFVSGYNDYDGWTESIKRQRLAALVSIICDNVRVLVANAVVQADFKAAYEKCPCSYIGTPYRFCAFLALPAVDDWRRRSPHRKPVALVFESGGALRNEYGRVLAQIGDFESSREKFGISSLTEGCKRDMFPLQAADVIAYATYKCLVQKRIDQYLSDAFETLFTLPRVGLLHSDAAIIERHLRTLEDAKNRYTQGDDANAKIKAPQGNAS